MAILADDLALPPRRFSLVTAIRRNPTIAFGGLLLAALIVMAILATLIATSDPFKIAPVNRLRPPSERSWFRRDPFGPHLFSRTRHRRRHQEHQAAAAPRAAQHAGAADRAVDLCLRLGDADRGGSQLSGRRRATGGAELGQHHRPGPHLLPDRALDDPDSRHVPGHHGARGEPFGRRAARPPRPQAGQKAMTSAVNAILEVRDLHTQFDTLARVVRAAAGASFELARGGQLGIVGESGCGQSVTALSILRLSPTETGRISSGSIRFEGEELTALSEEAMKRLRGHRMPMIFHEPITSLNPVLTVGTQIAENVVRHLGVPWRAGRGGAGQAPGPGLSAARPRRRHAS